MKLTWIMIIAAVLVFAYSFFFTDTAKFFELYGFSWSNLLARPYTLVTSIFLHGSLTHLLSNVLVWIAFGTAVESELGKGRMLAIFFLGAFLGDVLSLAFYPLDTLSIGASAGIFALVGVGMLVKPVDISFLPFIVPMPLALLGMAYAAYNVYGFIFNIDPQVSYVGHFGGLIVGMLFGFHKTGLRKGLKIMLVTLGILALVPLAWFLLVA